MKSRWFKLSFFIIVICMITSLWGYAQEVPAPVHPPVPVPPIHITLLKPTGTQVNPIKTTIIKVTPAQAIPARATTLRAVPAQNYRPKPATRDTNILHPHIDHPHPHPHNHDSIDMPIKQREN
jgi:hypothetical protein